MLLLRASSQQSGQDLNLEAVMSGAAAGDTGVPQGGLLIEFGEAVLGNDEGRLKRARDAIVATMGDAALVDAAGVAGLFNAIDRVADATGAPLEDWRLAQSEDFREKLRIDDFATRKSALEADISPTSRPPASPAR